MITNVVIGFVQAIVTVVDAILPHFTIPSWLTAGNIIPSGVSSFIGALLYTISPFFPSSILTEIFVGIASMWPFVAAYTVAQWVYRHIPTIFGFGVGGG